MRSRPILWFLISLFCLGGAGYFWHLGNQWAAEKSAAPATTNAPALPPTTRVRSATNSSVVSASTAPMILLSQQSSSRTNATSPLTPRLSNTTRKLGQLLRDDHAVLLENALLDTTRPPGLTIPENLRAPADPGSYIVQARGPVNDAFRAALAAAGATVISYIPNNAFLVRASATAAQQLAGNPRTQAVLPYEPAYKLKSALFSLAMEQKPLPSDTALNVVMFADAHADTVAELKKMGAQVLAESSSPFGPVVTVVPLTEDWTSVARLAGVELVEMRHRRVSANDLSRARLGVATDSTTTTNYFGLTGNGVLVSVNDTGVDAMQPDLTGRVTGFGAVSLVDTDGHGTHVAGIIASSGGQSITVSNASGSVNPGTTGQYRGKAPFAKIYSQSLELITGPVSEFDLQQNAALTNAFISNNSWHYLDDNQYDLGAASFDAAVRDALPYVTGSQPTLYVFAAGNSGLLNNPGSSDNPGTIQSPGTAKNVITVGALEQPRNITNEVVAMDGITNKPWQGMTSSDNEVAEFSSRGNVGVGIEGVSGRYKPDVVAPGTFVVSTRSQSPMDEQAYYNPTNHHYNVLINQVVAGNSLRNESLLVPGNAVAVFITVFPSADSPDPLNLPIFVKQSDIPEPPIYDAVRTNQVVIPPDIPLVRGSELFYSVGNPTSSDISYNLVTDIITTNDLGNYYTVLSNLNKSLGPYYRYESGTSMSAADVSGVLALMQEFFQNLHLTNSPALYKALLINGARSVSSSYDYQVSNPVNYQGWGLPSISNSIPAAILTNGVAPGTPSSIRFFDQSPINALATGEQQTRNVTVNGLGRGQPLRVTLVWTDPPGNPAASVKLVNDLDLVVTNRDTGEVYVGNDIPAASNFNNPVATNTPPTFDSVNNVEVVYLPPTLSTNYFVTVRGRRVNVNAVTAQTNNVAQDYALVISSGNGEVINALTVTEQPVVSLVPEPLAGLTNSFANSPGISGTLIYNQRVGANTQLLGTTNGITNQWHFYVLTNSSGFSNAAFVTFLPPPLAVPRMGVTNFDDPDQATRIEADIDLYVSIDPGLLVLDPTAIANSDKSRRRGGTEFVFYTNSFSPLVYYVGVKSEDQMACEYSFLGVFSQSPFSERDAEGNLIVHGLPLPTPIPDGSPASPGAANVLGLATEPITVRQVTVTNSLFTENLGDLLGNLRHEQKFSVLNNHRGGDAGNYTFVYDDSGETPSQHTDGPGSLRNFVGEEGQGVWVLTMVDNSLSQTGIVTGLTLKIAPTADTNGVTELDVAPNSFAYLPVNVPLGVTNMTICVQNLSPDKQPLELYVRREGFPTRTTYDYFWVIPPIGTNCFSISTADLPPLQAGRYFIGVFNASGVSQRVRILVTLEYDLAPIVPLVFAPSGNQPLLDDAVTYSSLFVTNVARIAQAEVALRINHPRVSDLAITLISPRGTRVLLMENRGMATPDGIGSSLYVTNVVPQSSAGGPAAQTNIVDTGATSGSLTIDYDFITEPDQMTVYYQGALLLDTGLRSGAGRLTVNYGPGASTQVTIIMNQFGNTNTTTAWNYTVGSVVDNSSYLIFTENTNHNGTPIKFTAPPFVGTPGATIPISDFDGSALGDYPPPPTVDGWSILTANPVTVVNNPLGQTPPNSLALRSGQIERTLATTPGQTYRLNFAYRTQPSIANILTGPLLNPANNHLYYLLAATDWANAEAQALSLGGQLVTINNAAEDAWVYTNFSNFGGQPRSLWIGLTDVASEFNFVWLDGDPSTYRNWRPGEPNNGGGFVPNENRVGIRGPDLLPPRLWNDVQDVDLLYPVVERTIPGAQIYIAGVVTNYFLGDSNWQTGGLLFQATSNSTTVGLSPLGTAQLTNGSFELGLAGWTRNNPGVVISPYVPASAGTNCVEVGIPDIPGSILSQVIPLVGGYNYSLTFDHLAWGDPVRTGILRVEVDSSAGLLVSQNYTNPAVNTLPVTYQTKILPFGVPPGVTSVTLRFIDLSPGNGVAVDPIVDNVKIVPPPTGVLVDSFTLTEQGGSLYALPEQFLKSLVGESAYGEWKLEVWDNRAGATNPTPTLVNWQLQLVFESIRRTPTTLQPGVPSTNSVAPGEIAYFIVDVPIWAKFATNTLIFATAPVDLLFNQTIPPTNGTQNNFTLLANSTGGSSTLSTVGTPQLLPGQRYYLGVQNNGAVTVTFALQVDFDITLLTSGVPVTGTNDFSGIPRYFAFDVSSNATAVTYQLTNLNGNAELVAQRSPALPTLTTYDYASFNPGAADEEIVIFTNSTPVALAPGRWYLGVYSVDLLPVTYTIVATEYTNIFPTIITLTNGIPYFNTNSGTGDLSDAYRYVVTPSAARAQFEINNPSGDMVLVARKGLPLPDLANYDYLSNHAFTNDELIVVFTNSTPVTLSPGSWYLSAINFAGAPVSYSIKATEWPVTGQPIVITNTTVVSNEFCLTWTSLPGVHYYVEGLTNLSGTNWVIVSPTLTAVDYFTTYCVPLPTPYSFFRVQEGLTATNAPIPVPPIITLTNGIPYFNTNSGTGNLSDAYRYVVTPSAARAQFEINNPSGDMVLVARKGLPLPDLANYDYLSNHAFTNDELIVVFTNSTPVPLSPGSWYLSALNFAGGPVSYSIKATEWPVTGQPIAITNTTVVSNEFCLTWTSLPGVHYYVEGLTDLGGTNWVIVSPTLTAVDYFTTYCVPLPTPYSFFRVQEGLAATNAPIPVPPIITLANGVPYPGVNPNTTTNIDYYRYVVTANAVRAQFEINNPSGDVTLLVRKGQLPTLATFDYQSANSYTNDELIVVFNYSSPVALTPGDWYLAAVNVSGGPVAYSIKATEWPVYGTNLNVRAYVSATNGFCLTWDSLIGAHYVVSGRTNISSTNWDIISPTITATSTQTTWCVSLPTPYVFFQVTEGLALSPIPPPVSAPAIGSVTATNNGYLLRWSAPVSQQFKVQWATNLPPIPWTAFTNIITSTNGQFLFFDDGTQTGGFGPLRFYRLRLYP